MRNYLENLNNRFRDFLRKYLRVDSTHTVLSPEHPNVIYISVHRNLPKIKVESVMNDAYKYISEKYPNYKFILIPKFEG